MGKWIAVVAAVLIAVVAVGAVVMLTGESDEDQIRSTVEEFTTAVGDGDGETACEQLTSEEQDFVAGISTSGSECQHGANALTEQASTAGADLDSLAIDRVDIDGGSAVVGFEDDASTFELERLDGDWKISDLTP